MIVGPIDVLLTIAILGVSFAVRYLTERPGDRVLFPSSWLGATAVIARAASEKRSWVAFVAAGFWVTATAPGALHAARTWRIRFELSDLLDRAARAFLLVGSSWLLLATWRGSVLGFGEAIVLLTVAHFHVAGFGLSALARSRYLCAPTNSRERALSSLGGWALLLGMPAVAIGQLTVGAVELIGAIVMTTAAWSVAASMSLAAERHARRTRTFLIVAALAPVAPMLIALHYASAQVFGGATLSYNVIASIHGALNLVLFVGLGLYASTEEHKVVNGALRGATAAPSIRSLTGIV